MNHRQKILSPGLQNQAYRQAFERLDAAFEKNTQLDISEKIRLLRLAMFADVDKLEASGRVVIPK